MTNWNQRLAETCESKNLNATELANRVKVSVPTASDWLKGKIKNLEAQNLLKICDVLGLDPWWLVLGIHKGKAPITEVKPPLSNEAKKLVSWVEHADSLGGPSLKILSHIMAALQIAENVKQAQHAEVVRELEEHERLLTPHTELKGADKHAPPRKKNN